jgi:adenosylcobinamide kinase/adenosylcobinamide-phosphate guanylyltransferase
MAQTSLTLVMGPARSGKSRWAEHLAASTSLPVTYVATGANLPDDDDWQQRLCLHRSRRPSSWTTAEVGFELAPFLNGMASEQLAMVDSLGSWVAWGLDLDGASWDATCTQLLASLHTCPAELIVVSEQVGWGVVPSTAIGGLFRDRLGALEQRLVTVASAVWLVVAGRAINVLASSLPVPP